MTDDLCAAFRYLLCLSGCGARCRMIPNTRGINMRLRTCLLAMAAAAMLPAAAANAGTITSTISFTATDFGSDAPQDTVTGSFTVTYDPTQTIFGATSITLNNLSIDLGSPLVFDYNPSAQAITIGGSFPVAGPFAEPGEVVAGSDDFDLQITNLTASSYFFAAFLYSQAGVPHVFTAGNLALTVTPGAVASTPIPGTLPLLGTGLAALGLLGLRRMRRSGSSMLESASAAA
jgi:hypothetical protein